MSLIAVIDYGMGNIHSIAKALQYVGPDCDICVTSNSKQIGDADRIVFPGVGAIRDCMHTLNHTGLSGIITEAAKSKPFLGICLGMQALLTDNEENNFTKSLNIIPGHVVRFPEQSDSDGKRLKIPHMGWNQVHQNEHPLWENISQDSRFYFVHSYYAKPNKTEVIVGTANYPDAFACALAQDNIFAVQFHPEKSQAAGLQLLKNFLRWDGQLY